jgi:hypothetical protein
LKTISKEKHLASIDRELRFKELHQAAHDQAGFETESSRALRKIKNNHSSVSSGTPN